MKSLRRRAAVALLASVVVLTPLVAAPARAGEQSAWAAKADKICARADDRMFTQLDRHANLDVTVPLELLTGEERRELLAILKIVGDTASRAARDLGETRATSADRVAVKAVIKALQHSAKTQKAAAVETRNPSDQSLLVADTASPDEIAAVGIDSAGALGAHECGALLDDLLWYRETSLLLGSTPEEIAALLVPNGPEGFTAVAGDPAGAIDIAQLAAEYAGTEETTDQGLTQLQDLGFNAGHRVAFESANAADRASIEVLEFADPVGAAWYLGTVRWATEDAIDDVYTVADIDGAWGYSESFPGGEVARFVAFRVGSLVFYVGMTGVPGYSEADVLELAEAQLAYL